MANLCYIPPINLYIRNSASEIAILCKTNDYFFRYFSEIMFMFCPANSNTNLLLYKSLLITSLHVYLNSVRPALRCLHRHLQCVSFSMYNSHCLKKSTIFPVYKKSTASCETKNGRSVALTFVVTKTLERLGVQFP